MLFKRSASSAKVNVMLFRGLDVLLMLSITLFGTKISMGSLASMQIHNNFIWILNPVKGTKLNTKDSEFGGLKWS